MKADEIRNISHEERDKKIVELKKKLFFLRLQRGIEQAGNTAKNKQIRRSIARIKTVIREEENRPR